MLRGLPSGHYYLGGTPYRFPGIDREPAYRFQGIGGLPPPLPSGHYYLGLSIDSLELIGSLPVDSKESEV